MEFGYIAVGKNYIAINDMNVLNYRIRLKKEPEGGYTVMVTSLPGCVTYGETIEDLKWIRLMCYMQILDLS